MKIAILIITVISFNFAQATLVPAPSFPAPELEFTDLPVYCFGTAQDNKNKEIEMQLVSDRVYMTAPGVFYNVAKSVLRFGAVNLSGAVLGVVFAGGGSQRWQAEIFPTSFGYEGELYVYSNSWDPNLSLITPGLPSRTTSKQTYDIICD